MASPFTLDGLNEKPFVLQPGEYDLLLYPCEWQGHMVINAQMMEEMSDIFYVRTYGRYTIYNLWTMFVQQPFAQWFEDDICLGYRNMLTNAVPEELPTIFYSEAFSSLQSAKLKELRTDVNIYRQIVNNYVAIPLIPAALSITNVEELSLGETRDPSAITALLEEFKNFLG